MYKKLGQEHRALTMYTDLRMFDLANEYLSARDNTDRWEEVVEEDVKCQDDSGGLQEESDQEEGRVGSKDQQAKGSGRDVPAGGGDYVGSAYHGTTRVS